MQPRARWTGDHWVCCAPPSCVTQEVPAPLWALAGKGWGGVGGCPGNRKFSGGMRWCGPSFTAGVRGMYEGCGSSGAGPVARQRHGSVCWGCGCDSTGFGVGGTVSVC